MVHFVCAYRDFKIDFFSFLKEKKKNIVAICDAKGRGKRNDSSVIVEAISVHKNHNKMIASMMILKRKNGKNLQQT